MMPPESNTKKNLCVKKSLAKLRLFRAKHNLCRECGIVKEPHRTKNLYCVGCALKHSAIDRQYKLRSGDRLREQRKILGLCRECGLPSPESLCCESCKKRRAVKERDNRLARRAKPAIGRLPEDTRSKVERMMACLDVLARRPVASVPAQKHAPVSICALSA